MPPIVLLSFHSANGLGYIFCLMTIAPTALVAAFVLKLTNEIGETSEPLFWLFTGVVVYGPAVLIRLLLTRKESVTIEISPDEWMPLAMRDGGD